MPEIDWDDMVVPRNVPVVLNCWNDDTASVDCGICGGMVAWTEDGHASRAMEFGALVDSFTYHVSVAHGG